MYIFFDCPAIGRQSCAEGERRTCSAALRELICGVVAISSATGKKTIALMREEQVRLSPLVCSKL
jgi:hypothetical protein